MSEQYIVSARKYRPQTFDTVIGQEHITTTLKNAIKNDHLAHAYLFTGPRGVGKTTCARILAKTINCTSMTPDTEACGVCDNCKASSDNSSFNIFELDAASNNSVDDIRALTEQVRFAPQMGRYKVYIIDEVHMLSTGAFNAFLKTLEEPPPYAIFILATTEKHKILPTIMSRCQIFDFKRIQTQDTVRHLQSIAAKESIDAEEAALHIIASQSEGCMRDALSILDRIVSFTNGVLTYANTIEHLNMLDAHTYFSMTDSLIASDYQQVLLTIEDLLSRGFEGNIILAGMAEHFRNLLLSRDMRMAKLLDIPADHKRNYFEKAQVIPESFLLSALKIVGDAEMQYNNATNKRLHLELCMIKLAHLKDTIQLTQFLQAEEIKKKISQLLQDSKDIQLLRESLNQLASEYHPISTSQDATIYATPDDNTVTADGVVSHQELMSYPTDADGDTVHALVEQDVTPLQNPVDDVPPSSDAVVQHTPVQQVSNDATTPKSSPRPKLGKDFLSRVKSKHTEMADEEVVITPLDQELLGALYQEYLEQLPVGKELLKRQIADLPITLLSQKEISITAPSVLQYNAIISAIPDFVVHIAQKTNNTTVRILPSLEETVTDSDRKILTKQEIFEVMRNAHPGLNALVDTLRLFPKILSPMPKETVSNTEMVGQKKAIRLDDDMSDINDDTPDSE